MGDYADLEIRILERESAGYPVEITLNDQQQFPRGYLDPAFLPWTASADPAANGERLFGWLLADAGLRATWAEVRGQQGRRRLRLRLDATAPELHALPWELLRDPGSGGAPAQYLAASSATPFSRYIAGRWRPGSPLFERPLRVLVAIANPAGLEAYGLQPLADQEEWELLQEVAADLPLALTRLPGPVTLSALAEALRDQFHVLHIVAHGTYSERRQQAALFLAGGGGQVEPVADEALAAMFARQFGEAGLNPEERLRLVFLASCQTATRSPADAFRGLAPQLIAAGVPAVLAMQDLVPVNTARRFATTFYDRLLEHGFVDLASNEARATLLAGSLPGAAIPVLYSRLPQSQLLGQRDPEEEKPAPSGPPPEEQPSALSRTRKILLQCGPFASDADVHTVFATTPKLTLWQHNIPGAGSPAARVEALMAYLIGRFRGDTKENGLVLFLQALSEKAETGDMCKEPLARVAEALSQELQPPDWL